MSHWTDEYLQMVEDCEARDERLTEWEQNFIDSIRHQLEEDRRLSDKQTETPERIWDKATEKG